MSDDGRQLLALEQTINEERSTDKTAIDDECILTDELQRNYGNGSIISWKQKTRESLMEGRCHNSVEALD